MKYRIILSAILALLPLTLLADPLPDAEDVIVDLLLGQCLSEKMKTLPPSGSIDPEITGIPITSDNDDARLTPEAKMIPALNGKVYYDHNAEYCNVHASEIDADRVANKIVDALDGLPLDVVRYEDRKWVDAKGVAKHDLTYGIWVPSELETLPIIAISHSTDGSRILTAGVTMGQQQLLRSMSVHSRHADDKQQQASLCLEAVNTQLNEAWGVPDPIHETPAITGDFNGDGLSDSACLGEGVPGTEDEWRLFVHLGNQDGPGQVIPLPEFSASTPVEWIRLFREPAGEFTTFCGLAPGECEADAMHKLNMSRDGIYLVVLEASSVLIYWDDEARSFKRQWLSD